MPYTQEPRGLTWINNINIAAFGPLVTQLLWVVGSLTLTESAHHLLRGDELQRQVGLLLATALLGAWLGKTGAGIYDNKAKREADPRYRELLEAKERGKAAGKNGPNARASGMYPMPATDEHPAMKADPG